jgi:hypothetical protein
MELATLHTLQYPILLMRCVSFEAFKPWVQRTATGWRQCEREVALRIS